MEKQSKKNKGEFAEKKLTQAEILERQQQRMIEQIQRNNKVEAEEYP